MVPHVPRRRVLLISPPPLFVDGTWAMQLEGEVEAELVCAGSRDTLVAYVWNLQNAQLLESLSGHEAPISSVAFSAAAAGGSTFLATGSWDKSVRVWDFVSSKAAVDVLTHTADVLALAFGPDGGSLATATLDGGAAKEEEESRQ